MVLSGPVYVVGNLMGQLEDLLMIFELAGSPRDTKYLFLGDYVDKGYYSVEVHVTVWFVTQKGDISFIVTEDSLS